VVSRVQKDFIRSFFVTLYFCQTLCKYFLNPQEWLFSQLSLTLKLMLKQINFQIKICLNKYQY